MKTVFIVDDSDANLMIAGTALEEFYKVFTIPSASRMFRLLEKVRPDLILLDVDMPECDGFSALERLKADKRYEEIPVIFLTATLTEETETKGFDLGAVDFIGKPFSERVLHKRVKLHIETDKLIKDGQEHLRKLQNAMISVIAELVEHRDRVTGGHIERTTKYLDILVKEMKKSGIYAEEAEKWDLSLLIPSAQLHDVGKIIVPDHILNKPGKLTADEFEIIKKHSSEGLNIISEIKLKSVDDGFLDYAEKFTGYHHEKWNGSGYPFGLKGDEIPLEGRVLAIADVYDALVSERPYKKPFSHEEAVRIINEGSGSHFDPKCVELFNKAESDFWVQSAVAESFSQTF
jgi:putative two-component system response regulator